MLLEPQTSLLCLAVGAVAKLSFGSLFLMWWMFVRQWNELVLSVMSMLILVWIFTWLIQNAFNEFKNSWKMFPPLRQCWKPEDLQHDFKYNLKTWKWVKTIEKNQFKINNDFRLFPKCYNIFWLGLFVGWC